MAITPGPWVVHESVVSLEVRAPSGVIADVFYGGGGVMFAPGAAEANAHLIAAAPDLLDACRDAYFLLDRIGDARKDREIIEALDAAIKKARGE